MVHTHFFHERTQKLVFLTWMKNDGDLSQAPSHIIFISFSFPHPLIQPTTTTVVPYQIPTHTPPSYLITLQLLHYPVTTLHAPQLVLLRLSITGKIWCNVSGSNFSALYPYIQYLTREYLSHWTLYVSHLFHMYIFHTLFSLFPFFTAHAFSLSLSLSVSTKMSLFFFSSLYFPTYTFQKESYYNRRKFQLVKS